MISWDYIYDYLGIKDFVYFISSPIIQEQLFPVKLVFIFFSVFFLCAVIWFYFNSSYIQYHFGQDVVEFFSAETYGLRKIDKSWKKIKRRLDSSSESEWKLAVIEADDFLYETMQDQEFGGDTFEDLVKSAGKKIPGGIDGVLEAHKVRNDIVYNPDYKINAETAQNMLLMYENAIKNIVLR